MTSRTEARGPAGTAEFTALLRVLRYTGIKFLRYVTLDIAGNVRCKVLPIEGRKPLTEGVDFAMVVLGGLPSHADIMVENAGLTAAAGSLQLRPDFASLRMLPYAPDSAVVLGNLYEQEEGEPSELCCRSLLEAMVKHALTVHNVIFTIGAEIEFVLFDTTDTPVDSTNFCDTAILDKHQSFVSELYAFLKSMDIEIELLHAESGHGQLEVVLTYQNDPVCLADHVVLTRQTIAAVARRHNLKALFLPKYNPNHAGNGLHMHISMKRRAGKQDVLFRADANSMSELAVSFVGGILNHLPALTALTMPTSNSFRRVGPGCWTGSSVQCGFDDKESPIRILSDRFEYKLLDATANVYLALAGILEAGLDGISCHASLPDMDGELPGSVRESLDLLEKDKLFADKFPAPLLCSYLAVRKAEANRETTLEQEVEEALKCAS